MKKICSVCKIIKPLKDFYLVNKKHLTRCIVCKKIKDKEYYDNGAGDRIKQKRQDNLLLFREKERKWRQSCPDRNKGKILQRYWPNSTWREALAKFNKLIVEQNNLCAICNKPETCLSKKGSYKLIRDLCVDHDHLTGKVRGLLCDACNSLIAKAKDNPEICKSAAVYLERTK